MACSVNCSSSAMSPSQFLTMYGPFTSWASEATGIIEALIITQWYEESGKGMADICAPKYNPANIGPNASFADICDGTLNGYINPMLGQGFKVNASDGEGDAASAYIMNAYTVGYIVPPSNLYGSLPGAGTKISAGFQAACAAMGAMGWDQANYYTTQDSPNIPGNILYNWYKDYFYGLVSTGLISNNTEPSCCFS